MSRPGSPPHDLPARFAASMSLLLFALLALLFASAPALAVTVSDERRVEQIDGSQGYLFKVTGHDPARDGEIFVVVTGSGGGRTVYRPERGIVAGSEWADYWGVVLAPGTEIREIEVLLLAPASSSSVAGKSWILADGAFGEAELRVEAAGDPTSGYDLKIRAKWQDGRVTEFFGRWDPAAPGRTVTAELPNDFASSLGRVFSPTLSSEALVVAEKMRLTLTPPAAWTERLRRGPGGTGEKPVPPGEGAPEIEISFPMSVKFDPRLEPFAMTMRIDPIRNQAVADAVAGSTWKEPFGVMPYTFRGLRLAADPALNSVTVSASASASLGSSAAAPVRLETVMRAGERAPFRVVGAPDAALVSSLLDLGGLPPGLKPAATTLLGGIKSSMLEFATNFPATKEGAALPRAQLKLEIEAATRKEAIAVSVDAIDLKDASRLALAVKEKFVPILEGGAAGAAKTEAPEAIASGEAASLEPWQLAEFTEGDVSVRIDALGDPGNGYELTGRIGLKGTSGLGGAGILPLKGRWDPARPDEPVTFSADNIMKKPFEDAFGRLLKPEWVELGDKISATLTLDPAWIKRLKAGGDKREAIETWREEGDYGITLSFPMKLKIDPTKPAFAMTVRVDPLERTSHIALDAGQSWEKPFGILPLKFSRVDVGTDESVTKFDVDAAGEMDFIVKALVDLELVRTAGGAESLKLDLKTSGDFVGGALELAGVPQDFQKVFTAFSKRIQFRGLRVDASVDGLTKGDLPDVGVDFSVDLPSWKHDFKINLPDVDLANMPLFAKRFSDVVWPIVKPNLPKIAMDLAFVDLAGQWPLVDLDLDIIRLDIDAAGNVTDGYTLTGIAGVKDVGEIKMEGKWNPQSPLAPIKFEAPNIFLPAYSLSLGKILPKGGFEMGDVIFVELVPDPGWVEVMQKAGFQTEEGAKRAGRKFKIDVGIPLKLKLDPTKPPLAMEMRVDLLTKIASMRLATGQVWEKPFGILPTNFTTLEVGTDKAMKALTVRAEGTTDFIMPGTADLDYEISSDGKEKPFTVVLNPQGDFLKELLAKSRFPRAQQEMLGKILPGVKLNELEIDGDYAELQTGKAGDIKFNVTLDALGVKKTFDIFVYKADFNKPDMIAKQVAAQLLMQMSGVDAKGMGKALLGSLGLAGKWTLIDENFAIIELKVEAEGAPEEGYKLDGYGKLAAVGRMNFQGRWDAADPLAPVVFEADNIFKPIFEKTLGSSIPKDKFEMKEKLYVVMGLAGPMVDALRSGSGTVEEGPAGGGDNLFGFSIDVNFPIKLQIDPTREAFDMVFTAKPLEQTATLALDAGVVWDKPYGIFPVTFSQLSAGTDPSFTTLEIEAAGNGDFLGPMDFNIEATFKKNEKPKMRILVIPSGDLVKNVLAKVKVPDNVLMPEIKLEKFDVRAGIDQLMKGKLPSAALKFTFRPSGGRMIGMKPTTVDIEVKEMDFTKPDKFAKEVGEQLVKIAQQLVTEVGPELIRAGTQTVKDVATDPVGTGEKVAKEGEKIGKDVAMAAYDFAKDPKKGVEDLGKGVANLGKNIGQSGYDAVAGEVNKWASDPVGAAEKNAKAVAEKAEEAIKAAEDFANQAADELANVMGKVIGFFTGRDPVAEAKKKLAEAKRKVRELQAIRDLRGRAEAATSIDELKAIQAEMEENPDQCRKKGDKVEGCYPATLDFWDEIEGMGKTIVARREADALAPLITRAKAAKSVAELDGIRADLNANPDLCWKENGQGYCHDKALAFEKEIIAARNELVRAENEKLSVEFHRNKLKRALDLGMVDAALEGIKEKPHMNVIENGKWVAHRPLTAKFVAEANSIRSLFTYYKQARTLDDFMKLKYAMDGRPPAGYPDLSPFPDQGYECQSLFKDITDKAAAYENSLKGIDKLLDEYRTFTPALTELIGFLDGMAGGDATRRQKFNRAAPHFQLFSSDNRKALKARVVDRVQEKLFATWSADIASWDQELIRLNRDNVVKSVLLTAAQQQTLREAINAREKELLNEAARVTEFMNAVWNPRGERLAEFDRVIEHVDGKTSSDYPDVSRFTAAAKKKIKDDLLRRKWEYRDLQDNNQKDIRKLVAGFSSVTQLQEYRRFLAECYKHRIEPGAKWPASNYKSWQTPLSLDADQIAALMKEVDAKIAGFEEEQKKVFENRKAEIAAFASYTQYIDPEKLEAVLSPAQVEELKALNAAKRSQLAGEYLGRRIPALEGEKLERMRMALEPTTKLQYVGGDPGRAWQATPSTGSYFMGMDDEIHAAAVLSTSERERLLRVAVDVQKTHQTVANLPAPKEPAWLRDRWRNLKPQEKLKQVDELFGGAVKYDGPFSVIWRLNGLQAILQDPKSHEDNRYKYQFAYEIDWLKYIPAARQAEWKAMVEQLLAEQYAKAEKTYQDLLAGARTVDELRKLRKSFDDPSADARMPHADLYHVRDRAPFPKLIAELDGRIVDAVEAAELAKAPLPKNWPAGFTEKQKFEKASGAERSAMAKQWLRDEFARRNNQDKGEVLNVLSFDEKQWSSVFTTPYPAMGEWTRYLTSKDRAELREELRERADLAVKLMILASKLHSIVNNTDRSAFERLKKVITGEAPPSSYTEEDFTSLVKKQSALEAIQMWEEKLTRQLLYYYEFIPAYQKASSIQEKIDLRNSLLGNPPPGYPDFSSLRMDEAKDFVETLNRAIAAPSIKRAEELFTQARTLQDYEGLLHNLDPKSTRARTEDLTSAFENLPAGRIDEIKARVALLKDFNTRYTAAKTDADFLALRLALEGKPSRGWPSFAAIRTRGEEAEKVAAIDARTNAAYAAHERADALKKDLEALRAIAGRSISTRELTELGAALEGGTVSSRFAAYRFADLPTSDRAALATAVKSRLNTVATAERDVTEMHRQILGATPAPADLERYVAMRISAGAPAVARTFFASPGFRGRIRTDQLAIVCRIILGDAGAPPVIQLYSRSNQPLHQVASEIMRGGGFLRLPISAQNEVRQKYGLPESLR